MERGTPLDSSYSTRRLVVFAALSGDHNDEAGVEGKTALRLLDLADLAGRLYQRRDDLFEGEAAALDDIDQFRIAAEAREAIDRVAGFSLGVVELPPRARP